MFKKALIAALALIGTQAVSLQDANPVLNSHNHEGEERIDPRIPQTPEFERQEQELEEYYRGNANEQL